MKQMRSEEEVRRRMANMPEYFKRGKTEIHRQQRETAERRIVRKTKKD